MECPKISINKMYITAQWRPQEKKDDYYASATKTMHPREAEYIRKDALLKWAKNLKERWEEPPMSKHSPGCVYMLEQLIEKLNSM